MSDVWMGGTSILDRTTKPRVILDTGVRLRSLLRNSSPPPSLNSRLPPFFQTTIILTSTSLATSINSQILLSHFNPTSEIWTVPCKTSFPTSPNVFFNLAGSSFGLPVEELAWRDDGTWTGMCLSGVQVSKREFRFAKGESLGLIASRLFCENRVGWNRSLFSVTSSSGITTWLFHTERMERRFRLGWEIERTCCRFSSRSSRLLPSPFFSPTDIYARFGL